jgi:hypothetical protein
MEMSLLACQSAHERSALAFEIAMMGSLFRENIQKVNGRHCLIG